MKLQFLINHYNEPPELIGRLLDSIYCQNIYDSEVLICHDDLVNGLDENFLRDYPNLTYFEIPHCGVCLTRNELLDRATAEYVMFCDADDMFCGSMKTMMRQEGDIVASPYYMERSDESLAILRRDIVRVHGKLFRRSYLVDNNIRFPDVPSNGDMYFLWLAFHLTEDITWVDNCFYVWKNNPLSVSRRIPFYNMQTYDRILRCYGLLADDLLSRGRKDLYDIVIAINVTVSYINACSDRWDTIPKEYTDHAKKAIAAFVRKYWGSYMELDYPYRYRKYEEMLKAKHSYGPPGGFKGMQKWAEEILTQNEWSVDLLQT